MKAAMVPLNRISATREHRRIALAAAAVALLSLPISSHAAQSLRAGASSADTSGVVSTIARGVVETEAGGNIGDHDPRFDFYVMSMSFQPEFCFEHRSEHFEGCSHPDDEWRGSLTIHGLWPERNDGSWPSMCNNEAFDPTVIDSLGRDRFEHHWPNVKSPPSSPEYNEFWTHEWVKHGTCSGLSQRDYFESALDSYVPTPPIIKLAEGSKVPKAALVSAYGGSDTVALVCEARRYLSEVRVCLGKNKDGSASGRIKCNAAVLEENSCYENEIYISTFPPADIETNN